jgi:ABC-type hemin transport system ATPase subunit
MSDEQKNRTVTLTLQSGRQAAVILPNDATDEEMLDVISIMAGPLRAQIRQEAPSAEEQAAQKARERIVMPFAPGGRR